jgi:aminodeoxyfutalosine synthase
VRVFARFLLSIVPSCGIYYDAGSDSPQELTVAELRRLIEEAGRVPVERVPVERDTLYHEVIRTEREWRTGGTLALATVP